MPNLIDLTNKRFGKLTVLRRAENKYRKNGKPRVMWECICDCGAKIIVDGVYLRAGDTTSCGCYAKELLTKRNYKHGSTKTRLYHIWKDMKKRCNNPAHHAHKYYYDIGIKVCDEWENSFPTFKKWAQKSGYNDELTIDRIDYNKGYSPDNCRWATMKEQGNNKRNNYIITFEGESHTLTEWGELLHINPSTIRARIEQHKWGVERALSTPVHRERR